MDWTVTEELEYYEAHMDEVLEKNNLDYDDISWMGMALEDMLDLKDSAYKELGRFCNNCDYNCDGICSYFGNNKDLYINCSEEKLCDIYICYIINGIDGVKNYFKKDGMVKEYVQAQLINILGEL